MRFWIFRGNREDFDIDTYLRDFKYVYWAVKHEKHHREIAVGDHVFIWRSKGKSKDPYGVVAYGRVVESPTHKDKVKHPEFLLEKYWKKRQVSPVKVGIKLKSTRLDLESGMIDSELVLSEIELSRMQLLTVRQGTNFILTGEQFNKLFGLWSGEARDTEEDEYSGEEGKARLRLHKVRERDRALVKKAKARFVKNNGSLFCEACGFNSNNAYNFNYAEAHHKKPLSKIKAGEKTRETDLAIVCANCHVAVHCIKSDDPWSALLKINGKL